MRLKGILRFYHTIKYLKPMQIRNRIKLIVSMKFYRHFPQLASYIYMNRSYCVHLRESCFLQGLEKEQLQGMECVKSRKKADSIVEGEYNFLNEKIRFHSPELIGWNSTELSQLWRYHLHYFDYAWNLGIAYYTTSEAKYYECFKSIVRSWIKNNILGIGDGWHPYTVSLRLVNWIYSYHLFKEALDKDDIFKNELLKYIFCKAKYLRSNLEYHVLGNHLLENGRALVFAGLFFDGKLASDWLQKGTEILWSQANEQILSDGGHFELSPMYHSIVLWDYLECINLLQMNGLKIPQQVLDKVEKMLLFQKAILHPDQRNPLFNDSAIDISPQPLEVLYFGSSVFNKDFGSGNRKTSCKVKCILGSRGNSVKSSPQPYEPLMSFKDSGYFIFRNTDIGSFLILDCGKPCPDYLPAHAHADMMSYELSIFDQRFIVDSGIYEYKQGKYRDYFRSTKAHNTVTVNDQNQCDVWGSFRVGQRGKPLRAYISQSKEAKIFTGSHDGYFHRYGVIHTRYLSEIMNHFWLVVDELDFKKGHSVFNQYSSYIHFHPCVFLDKQYPDRFDLVFEGRPVSVLPFGSNDVETGVFLSEGPEFSYSPKFGEYRSKLTLQLSIQNDKPVVFGYVIFPLTEQGDVRKVSLVYKNIEDYSLTIQLEDPAWQFKKNTDGVQIERCEI